MKKLAVLLIISILTLGLYAQVKSRISTRTGVVDQLKTFGRVSYMGQNYFPIGKDSLLVKNDIAKLDSVFIPKVLTIDNKPYVVSGFKSMAFEYDVTLKYIEIPATITEISNSCFYGCSRLSECKMPGVNIIQGYAFFRTGFERLTFHEGLEKIGGSAFRECHNLRYIELPTTLSYIGDNAFLGCEQLDTVKVKFREPIELGSNVYWVYRPNTQRKNKVLLVPAGSKPAFEADEQWNLFQTILEY